MFMEHPRERAGPRQHRLIAEGVLRFYRAVKPFVEPQIGAKNQEPPGD